MKKFMAILLAVVMLFSSAQPSVAAMTNEAIEFDNVQEIPGGSFDEEEFTVQEPETDIENTVPSETFTNKNQEDAETDYFESAAEEPDMLGYTSYTRDEAMAWVKSQIGQTIGDGQCVALIHAYYSYLGVAPFAGNAGEYATDENAIPEGWQRIQDAVPQPGDVLIYTASADNLYGHVAIFESENSTYHQNYANVPSVQQVTIAYNGFTNPYWGVIRPDFRSPVQLTGVWEGTYTGHSGNETFQRNIRLDIDEYTADGKFGGIATIEAGVNGKYYFEGTIDLQTNAIRFKGKEWLKNPSNFSFVDFKGVLDTNSTTISGFSDGNEKKPFSLSKISDTPVSLKVDFSTLPKDYEGEYDGHSSSIIVRRNIEIHIQEISGDGSINGTAIISPSNKAADIYGANGSYYFRGKIDARYGKIKMQGYKWIDYPVGHDNFTFVALEGLIDTEQGTIKGSSEDGIWSMAAIDYNSVQTDSGFTLGKDNNSYSHSNGSAYGGFAGIKNYSIDRPYFERLTAASSDGETDQLKKKMQEEWKGSCYGIAMSMGLLYEKYIDISDLTDTPGKTTYYSLDKPYQDRKLLNEINYYQLSQFLENGGKQSATLSKTYNYGIFSGLANWLTEDDSLSVFLKNLVNYSVNDHIAVLGYGISEGGHAVLVTGCEFDKASDKYIVEIYDENSVGTSSSEAKGAFGYMEIKKDFSGFSYVDANRCTVNNNTYKYMYMLDWNKLNNIVLNLQASPDTDNHVRINIPMGDDFKISNDSGKYISCDGTRFTGNMAVYDIDTVEVDDGAHLIIETDPAESFTLTEMGASVDLEVYSNSDFLALAGNSIDSAVLTIGSGITLKGDTYDFEAYISTDKVNDNENGLVSISAAATSDVSITQDGTNVVVKADSELDNVSTSAYTGTDVTENSYNGKISDLTVSGSDGEHAHTYSKWKITKAATALAKGSKQRTCSICGHIEKKSIAKLKATAKLNVTKLPLKVQQSTTKVKVSGLAKGDFVKSWKSSNKKIVTVTNKGKITAKNKPGKATITITLASGLKKQVQITVQKSSVITKKISGVPKTMTLKKGKSKTLKPVITPLTSTNKTTYVSSNKNVATVNSQGKITAKKKGVATITVKSGKKSVKCKVTVK